LRVHAAHCMQPVPNGQLWHGFWLKTRHRWPLGVRGGAATRTSRRGLCRGTRQRVTRHLA
jgi:hypothetical protein